MVGVEMARACLGSSARGQRSYENDGVARYGGESDAQPIMGRQVVTTPHGIVGAVAHRTTQVTDRSLALYIVD